LAPSGVATAAPAAGAAATPAASAGTSLGGVGSALKSWGPLALGAGGLGMNLLKGNQAIPQSGNLSALAATDQTQGNQLQSYLSSGTLPPGVQAGLNSAAQSAEATIRSQYASRGQSGSSAEAQAISSMNQQVVTNGASIATGLLQQGISESNMSTQIYQSLMNAQIQKDATLSSSISGFAGALAGQGLKTPGG
jgi:hypothetical protein